MHQIVCFIQYIDTSLPKVYKVYEELVDCNFIASPILYTDKCNLLLSNNIPIFNTYYMRQHFLDTFIILDHNDLVYVPKYLKHKCIILYDNILPDNEYRECFKAIKYTENIKDKLNEKL